MSYDIAVFESKNKVGGAVSAHEVPRRRATMRHCRLNYYSLVRGSSLRSLSFPALLSFDLKARTPTTIDYERVVCRIHVMRGRGLIIPFSTPFNSIPMHRLLIDRLTTSGQQKARSFCAVAARWHALLLPPAPAPRHCSSFL